MIPETLKGVKRLIFDYGGTLDTDGRHWAYVLWDAYRAVGVPVTEAQFREAYVYGERSLARRPVIVPSDNFHDLLVKKLEEETQYLVQAGHWTPTEAERKHAVARMADYCYNYVELVLERSRVVLEHVRKKYRPVLVTNFYGNMMSVLDDFNMSEYFDYVVESAVVGVRKPDPRIFQLGVDATGCPADKVCVVGDSFEKDIVPAHQLGCHTVWFHGEQWTEKPVDESLPDAIITAIGQLPALFP
jgi:HAD superfamily hydrolase (TIGR01509 family)